LAALCWPVVEVTVRRAHTGDVPAVRRLVDLYADRRILLDKPTVALYEDVQEFWVAEEEGRVVGCGALHVIWEDLAEIRTVAVDPEARGRGIGHAIVEKLIETARWLGVERVFVLTFEVEFFARHGFVEIEGAPVSPEVYEELRRSFDEGVAEFLDLERVKPNTLGNARMLLYLRG
jgi:amino-acid N-acetyltransferase